MFENQPDRIQIYSKIIEWYSPISEVNTKESIQEQVKLSWVKHNQQSVQVGISHNLIDLLIISEAIFIQF